MIFAQVRVRTCVQMLALAVAAVAAGATATGYGPQSIVITVSRLDDPNPDACLPADCSLREALILANGTPGYDTINLPAGTYQMDLGLGAWYEDGAYASDLDITDDLKMTGAGAGDTIITTTPELPERGFDVLMGVAAEMTDLSVRDLWGGFQPIDCGRGIRSRGNLTLERVVIANNRMRGSGGGICNEGGTLVVRDSVLSDNCACLRGVGGGIYSTGPTASTVLERVILSDNVAQADPYSGGGGIHASRMLSITDSLVVGNQAAGPFGKRTGGGIEAGGAVTLTNVTLSGNHTDGEYVGIGEIDSRGAALRVGGNVTLTNVTIAGNESETTAGGIYYSGGGTLTMVNTIIAGNTGGDCEGAVTSGGHNIDGDGSCGLGAAGDLPDTDPLLGPLADNGGPTQTHALLAGSPAIDAGDAAACPAGDQRGYLRPAGAGCDIGSFESGAPEPSPSPSPSPTPTFSPVVRGDADCDEDADSVDALAALRLAAGLSTDAGCLLAANVDCSLAVDSVDALLILRFVAALPVTLPPGCPPLGPP